jgi:hypothetical protein
MKAKKNKEQLGVNTGGGAYVGGDVHTQGGDFVGRDQVVSIGLQQGATLDEFVHLLGEMRRLLPQSGLDKDTAQVVEGDFRVVEEQAQKPKPNRAIILGKLKGAAEALTAAATLAEAGQKLLPMAQKAAQWAGQLFR